MTIGLNRKFNGVLSLFLTFRFFLLYLHPTMFCAITILYSQHVNINSTANVTPELSNSNRETYSLLIINIL